MDDKLVRKLEAIFDGQCQLASLNAELQMMRFENEQNLLDGEPMRHSSDDFNRLSEKMRELPSSLY